MWDDFGLSWSIALDSWAVDYANPRKTWGLIPLNRYRPRVDAALSDAFFARKTVKAVRAARLEKRRTARGITNG